MAKNGFSTVQWIAWISATIAACVTLMGGAYATFETANHAKDRAEVADKRMDRMESMMDRIEGKIDTVLEQTK